MDGEVGRVYEGVGERELKSEYSVGKKKSIFNF